MKRRPVTTTLLNSSDVHKSALRVVRRMLNCAKWRPGKVIFVWPWDKPRELASVSLDDLVHTIWSCYTNAWGGAVCRRINLRDTDGMLMVQRLFNRVSAHNLLIKFYARKLKRVGWNMTRSAS